MSEKYDTMYICSVDLGDATTRLGTKKRNYATRIILNYADMATLSIPDRKLQGRGLHVLTINALLLLRQKVFVLSTMTVGFLMAHLLQSKCATSSTGCMTTRSMRLGKICEDAAILQPQQHTNTMGQGELKFVNAGWTRSRTLSMTWGKDLLDTHLNGLIMMVITRLKIVSGPLKLFNHGTKELSLVIHRVTRGLATKPVGVVGGLTLEAGKSVSNLGITRRPYPRIKLESATFKSDLLPEQYDPFVQSFALLDRVRQHVGSNVV